MTAGASLHRAGARGPTIGGMTFRVYVRWQGQRVSDKTTTDSRAVAEAAFAELLAAQDRLAKRGALGIALTEDGKALDYRPLQELGRAG